MSNVIVSDRGKKARAYFEQGYNCAQSVAMAFSDIIGEDEERVAALISGFGGGMGRLRDTCGAFSGIVFVLGAVYGYGYPDDVKKAILYDKVKSCADTFKEQNGAMYCRDLLAKTGIVDGDRSGRPCPDIVERAATLLEKILNSDK